jgi:3-phosphoshikimate 1-carboxyvinyltransferase
VPTSCGNNDDLSFRTYSDHRIAMALAPLAMLTGSVLLDEVSVVSKSYPNYWKDLENLNVAVLQ